MGILRLKKDAQHYSDLVGTQTKRWRSPLELETNWLFGELENHLKNKMLISKLKKNYKIYEFLGKALFLDLPQPLNYFLYFIKNISNGNWIPIKPSNLAALLLTNTFKQSLSSNWILRWCACGSLITSLLIYLCVGERTLLANTLSNSLCLYLLLHLFSCRSLSDILPRSFCFSFWRVDMPQCFSPFCTLCASPRQLPFAYWALHFPLSSSFPRHTAWNLVRI